MSPDFFERPAPVADPSPQPLAPPWTGPPYGVLPGAVALEVVLAANERAAVSIGRCAAYATGFELDVRVLVAPGADELDPSLNGVYHRPGRGSSYEEMLRFGIEFADGRKVTNVGGGGHGGREPDGPVLWGMGGGGGGGRWQQDFWVWPLPPAGAVGIVSEWPAAGIALTRVDIDAQLLIDAAARAREMFPNQATSHPGAPGHRSASSTPGRPTTRPRSNRSTRRPVAVTACSDTGSGVPTRGPRRSARRIDPGARAAQPPERVCGSSFRFLRQRI